MMMRRPRWYLIAPLALMGIALFIFIGGSAVQLLWNWLAPALFGWHEITFWQAIGILALCRILFGGFGRGGGHSGGRMGRHMRQRFSDRLSDRMAERWDEMTPEERERFRERVRDRFGFGPSAAAGAKDL